MAFWRRINQSKLQLISNQYKRFHFQAPYASSSLHQTRISVLEKPICSIDSKPSYFYTNVRSFAAPVQTNKNKKAEAGKEKPRLNKQITASVVRLVMEDGEHSIVSIQEALQHARKKGLDLVEVQKKDPPVCRLMDYNKETYKRKQKEKEIAKNKSGDMVKKGMCKIRFTGKIEEKDLKMKAQNVIRLMEKGYRVKCMAMGTGKEDDVEDLGGILSRLTNLIEDVCFVESGPNIEKTNAFVIVKHTKFGPTKKGGAKKAKAAGGDMAKPSTDNQSPLLPHDECGESGSDSEDTLLSDEDDLPLSSPMQMQNENLDEKFLHPKPGVNSTASNTSRFPRPETPLETDNRYKRSEPRNRFPPDSSVKSELQFPYARREPPNMGQRTRESVGSNQFQYPPRQSPQSMDQSTRESVRSESQFRYPPRQSPQSMDQSTRESVRSESQFRYPPRQPAQNMGQNSRQPVKSEPQFPYQPRKLPQNMNSASSVQERKQVENEEASKPTNNAPSFGIFSTPKSNSSVQGIAADAPNNEGNRYAPIRNRGMGGNGANQNIPGSQFDGSRKPGNNTSGQDKFGIFSTPK